jgi:hypothetical protein
MDRKDNDRHDKDTQTMSAISSTTTPHPAPPASASAAGANPQEELVGLSRVRHACNWFGLFHLCARTRCRKARGCRGNPVSCLREGAPRAPAAVRALVRHMLESQDRGLSFDEAMDELADGQFVAYECWIAGIQARRA